MNMCEYGCGQIGQHQLKNEKWCCSKTIQSCPEVRKKISKANKGKNHPMFGKTHSEKSRKKMSEIKILSLKQIRKKYPFFSQIEDMRYNPDKPGKKEIQVHCKYNKCPNSKKNGGWFTPTKGQFGHRIYALENPRGFGESNFYCSEKCKINCPLFKLTSDPNQNKEQLYTSEEYETFKQEVLKRQLQEYGYNFCEYCELEENLHVHHEKPQKTNPLFVLDPDNGVVFCKDCHYIIGHKDECSTGNLANKINLDCTLGSKL